MGELVALLFAGIVAVVVTAGAYLRSRVRRRRFQTLLDLTAEITGSRQPDEYADPDLEGVERALTEAVRDVRRTIDDLRIEAARREAILSSMGEGVLAVDHDRRVIFCNAAIARAVGMRNPVRNRMPLLELVRDSEIQALIDEVIESGKDVKRSLRIGAASGRSYQIYAAPFERGSSRGAIAIFHDITDLERLEQVRKDFIANVSHEMRTPLASIIACADTLLEGALEEAPANRRFVEIVKANANRLNSISADLLILSDLESGVTPGEPERISVREALETAVRTVQAEANTSDIQITAGPIEDLFVTGYKFRLEQALMNLLVNAVKFNRPGGEVRAQARRADDRSIEISVSDTGIGIPSQDLPRIFERFYRVDKARSRRVGGTGLGLSIVKHVVEGMNGSVKVDSQLARGSTFTITFPPASDGQ